MGRARKILKKTSFELNLERELKSAKDQIKFKDEELNKIREYVEMLRRNNLKEADYFELNLTTLRQDLKHAQSVILILGSELDIIKNQDLNRNRSFNDYQATMMPKTMKKD